MLGRSIVSTASVIIFAMLTAMMVDAHSSSNRTKTHTPTASETAIVDPYSALAPFAGGHHTLFSARYYHHAPIKITGVVSGVPLPWSTTFQKLPQEQRGGGGEGGHKTTTATTTTNLHVRRFLIADAQSGGTVRFSRRVVDSHQKNNNNNMNNDEEDLIMAFPFYVAVTKGATLRDDGIVSRGIYAAAASGNASSSIASNDTVLVPPLPVLQLIPDATSSDNVSVPLSVPSVDVASPYQVLVGPIGASVIRTLPGGEKEDGEPSSSSASVLDTHEYSYSVHRNTAAQKISHNSNDITSMSQWRQWWSSRHMLTAVVAGNGFAEGPALHDRVNSHNNNNNSDRPVFPTSVDTLASFACGALMTVNHRAPMAPPPSSPQSPVLRRALLDVHSGLDISLTVAVPAYTLKKEKKQVLEGLPSAVAASVLRALASGVSSNRSSTTLQQQCPLWTTSGTSAATATATATDVALSGVVYSFSPFAVAGTAEFFYLVPFPSTFNDTMKTLVGVDWLNRSIITNTNNNRTVTALAAAAIAAANESAFPPNSIQVLQWAVGNAPDALLALFVQSTSWGGNHCRNTSATNITRQWQAIVSDNGTNTNASLFADAALSLLPGTVDEWVLLGNTSNDKQVPAPARVRTTLSAYPSTAPPTPTPAASGSSTTSQGRTYHAIGNHTSRTAFCSIGDVASFRGLYVPPGGNMTLAVTDACFIYDTVDAIHAACQANPACVGFTTVQMPTDPIRKATAAATSTVATERPLCTYKEGKPPPSPAHHAILYPRMFYEKPLLAATKPRCGVVTAQSGTVAVYVQQTVMATHAVAVVVDGVTAAVCGGEHLFANRAAGLSGRCHAAALCKVVPTKAGSVVEVRALQPMLHQGGCPNTLGVLWEQLTVDRVQVPLPPPEPIDRPAGIDAALSQGTAADTDTLKEGAIIQRRIVAAAAAGSASTTTSVTAVRPVVVQEIRVFVWKASAAALGVWQTSFAPTQNISTTAAAAGNASSSGSDHVIEFVPIAATHRHRVGSQQQQSPAVHSSSFSPSLCQWCGGSAGFYKNGRQGHSGECETEYFCNGGLESIFHNENTAAASPRCYSPAEMVAAAAGTSASGTSSDKINPIFFSGFLRVRVNVGALYFTNAACSGFMGRVYAERNVSLFPSSSVANTSSSTSSALPPSLETIPLFPLHASDGAFTPLLVLPAASVATATATANVDRLPERFFLLPSELPTEAMQHMTTSEVAAVTVTSANLTVLTNLPIGPTTDLLTPVYVPWSALENEALTWQDRLRPNTTMACVLDHTEGLSGRCTFHVPRGATHFRLRANQVDFVASAISITVDGHGTPTATGGAAIHCGASHPFRGGIAGGEDLCDTYHTCTDRVLYDHNDEADNATETTLTVEFPSSWNPRHCEVSAIVLVDFYRPASVGASSAHSSQRECTRDEFECPAERICLAKEKLCDRIRDCESGADEFGCRYPFNLPNEVLCHAQLNNTTTTANTNDSVALIENMLKTYNLSSLQSSTAAHSLQSPQSAHLLSAFDRCRQQAVLSKSYVFSLHPSNNTCTVLNASLDATAAFLASPERYLCSASSGGATYLRFPPTSSSSSSSSEASNDVTVTDNFLLCRASIHCSGHGQLITVSDDNQSYHRPPCACRCSTGYTGTHCQFQSRLEGISHVVAVFAVPSPQEAGALVHPASVARALRLGSEQVRIVCGPVIPANESTAFVECALFPESDAEGGSSTSASQSSSGAVADPSAITEEDTDDEDPEVEAHIRHLFLPSARTAINTILESNEHPPLLFFSSRSHVSPVRTPSAFRCASSSSSSASTTACSATNSTIQFDRVRVIAARSHRVASARLAVVLAGGPTTTSMTANTTAVSTMVVLNETCVPVSAHALHGCVVSICELIMPTPIGDIITSNNNGSTVVDPTTTTTATTNSVSWVLARTINISLSDVVLESSTLLSTHCGHESTVIAVRERLDWEAAAATIQAEAEEKKKLLLLSNANNNNGAARRDSSSSLTSDSSSSAEESAFQALIGLRTTTAATNAPEDLTHILASGITIFVGCTLLLWAVAAGCWLRHRRQTATVRRDLEQTVRARFAQHAAAETMSPLHSTSSPLSTPVPDPGSNAVPQSSQLGLQKVEAEAEQAEASVSSASSNMQESLFDSGANTAFFALLVRVVHRAIWHHDRSVYYHMNTHSNPTDIIITDIGHSGVALERLGKEDDLGDSQQKQKQEELQQESVRDKKVDKSNGESIDRNRPWFPKARHWASALTILAVACGVLAACLVLYHFTASKTLHSNFSILVEVYSDDRCAGSPFAPVPVSAFVVPGGGHHCAQVHTLGESDGEIFASGMCTGPHGQSADYTASLVVSTSEGHCESASARPVSVASGRCVPLQALDAHLYHGKQWYAHVRCADTELVDARFQLLTLIEEGETTSSTATVSATTGSASSIGTANRRVIADPPVNATPRLREGGEVTQWAFLAGTHTGVSSTHNDYVKPKGEARTVDALATGYHLLSEENDDPQRMVFQDTACTFSDEHQQDQQQDRVTQQRLVSTTATSVKAACAPIDAALPALQPLLESAFLALSPAAMQWGPSSLDEPIGHLFGRFGTSAPQVGAEASGSAHRYYGPANTAFDVGAKFPSSSPPSSGESANANALQDGDGYTVSMFLRMDRSTEGFAFGVCDAFEDTETGAVHALDRLGEAIRSGQSGPAAWFDPNLAPYRVYQSLFVDGPASTLIYAFADPDRPPSDRVQLLTFDLAELGLERAFNGHWHHVALLWIVENSKLRVQLVVDGETSFSKVGWSRCIDHIPPPIGWSSFLQGQWQQQGTSSSSTTSSLTNTAPVFRVEADVVYEGGLLVTGYFNGGVHALHARNEEMPVATLLREGGTAAMREQHAFPREATLGLGVGLLLLTGILLLFMLLSSVCAAAIGRGGKAAVGPSDEESASRGTTDDENDPFASHENDEDAEANRATAREFYTLLFAGMRLCMRRARHHHDHNKIQQSTLENDAARHSAAVVRMQFSSSFNTTDADDVFAPLSLAVALRWTGLPDAEAMALVLREVTVQSRRPGYTLLRMLYRCRSHKDEDSDNIDKNKDNSNNSENEGREGENERQEQDHHHHHGHEDTHAAEVSVRLWNMAVRKERLGRGGTDLHSTVLPLAPPTATGARSQRTGGHATVKISSFYDFQCALAQLSSAKWERTKVKVDDDRHHDSERNANGSVSGAGVDPAGPPDQQAPAEDSSSSSSEDDGDEERDDAVVTVRVDNANINLSKITAKTNANTTTATTANTSTAAAAGDGATGNATAFSNGIGSATGSVANGASGALATTSAASAGIFAQAAAVIAPVVAVLQTVHIWSTAMHLPDVYDTYGRPLFAVVSIDWAALLPEVPTLVTPLVQVFAGLVAIGLVFHFMLLDNDRFEKRLAQYVWRRDERESSSSSSNNNSRSRRNSSRRQRANEEDAATAMGEDGDIKKDDSEEGERRRLSLNPNKSKQTRRNSKSKKDLHAERLAAFPPSLIAAALADDDDSDDGGGKDQNINNNHHKSARNHTVTATTAAVDNKNPLQIATTPTAADLLQGSLIIINGGEENSKTTEYVRGGEASADSPQQRSSEPWNRIRKNASASDRIMKARAAHLLPMAESRRIARHFGTADNDEHNTKERRKSKKKEKESSSSSQTIVVFTADRNPLLLRNSGSANANEASDTENKKSKSQKHHDGGGGDDADAPLFVQSLPPRLLQTLWLPLNTSLSTPAASQQQQQQLQHMSQRAQPSTQLLVEREREDDQDGQEVRPPSTTAFGLQEPLSTNMTSDNNANTNDSNPLFDDEDDEDYQQQHHSHEGAHIAHSASMMAHALSAVESAFFADASQRPSQHPIFGSGSGNGAAQQGGPLVTVATPHQNNNKSSNTTSGGGGGMMSALTGPVLSRVLAALSREPVRRLHAIGNRCPHYHHDDDDDEEQKEEEEEDDNNRKKTKKTMKCAAADTTYGPRLVPQQQSDVLPFSTKAPCCCAVIDGRVCGRRTGTIYCCPHKNKTKTATTKGGSNSSCRTQQSIPNTSTEGTSTTSIVRISDDITTDVVDGENHAEDDSVCGFALCEEHIRLSLVDQLIASALGTVRAIRREGPAWVVCILLVAIANAAYTPVIKTALMILGCHPFYQCEFPHCWRRIDPKFALAAFLSVVILLFLGVGLPAGLVMLLSRRWKTLQVFFLDPAYEGRYHFHDDEDNRNDDDDDDDDSGSGDNDTDSDDCDKNKTSNDDNNQNNKGQSESSSAAGNTSPRVGEDNSQQITTTPTATTKKKKRNVSFSDAPPTARESRTANIIASTKENGNKKNNQTASARNRRSGGPSAEQPSSVAAGEWARFVESDASAMAQQYQTVVAQWMFFGGFVIGFKVLALLPALFLDRGTLGQRAGIAAVEVLVAAAAFLIRSQTSALSVWMLRLASVHQLALLGLQNVDLVMAFDYAMDKAPRRGVTQAPYIPSDPITITHSGWSIASPILVATTPPPPGARTVEGAVTPPLPVHHAAYEDTPTAVGNYMLLTTALYLLACLATLAAAMVGPVLAKRLRDRRTQQFLNRHGLDYSRALPLYLDPYHHPS